MSDLHKDHEAVRAAISQTPLVANPEQHNLKQLPPPHIHWLRRIILWVLGAVVVVVLVFAVGFLRFSWQRPSVLWAARALHLPVTVVGNHWLSYVDYQQDVPNITSYLQRNEPPDAASQRTLSTDVYTRKIILNKIIGEEILASIAREQNVTVTDADVQKTYDGYVEQSGNAADVEQYIKTLYGWTVEQFKLKLIKPQVIQEKLAEKYFADVKSQVTTIRESVTADTFAEVASKDSDDVATAAKGGAVELNTKALADAYTADAVKIINALGDKQISSVLETSRGYEIVLLEKKAAAAKKADGTVYTMRRIVKTPDFNTWLSNLVTAKAEKLRVILFEPRFRWESACGVLAKSEPSCETAATNTNQNTNTTK
jgi:hypothetical protein